ncbi:ATP-binding cassette domain-containing protein [Facklamia lactis]|uniref:ATP-binding cassette domain-containing protein n=1 Tax=Facklamia lactis TaxID=2749967 RepID=UPI0018CDD3FB|nr:ABC transporter ATP-binding protein [Facklamia lactis]MBG9979576.1 ABC transporter ATP-binding protein [Facklamia lactis]
MTYLLEVREEMLNRLKLLPTHQVLLAKLKDNKKLLISQTFFVLIFTFIHLINPMVTGKVIGIISDQEDVNQLLKISALALFLGFLMLLVSRFKVKNEIINSEKVKLDLNEFILTFLKERKWASIEDYEASYLHSAVNEDVSTLVSFIFFTIPRLIGAVASFLLIMMISFLYYPKLLLLFIILVILYTLIYFFTRNGVYESAVRVRQDYSYLFSFFNQAYHRLLVFKIKEILAEESLLLKKRSNLYLSSLHENFKWNYILSTSRISIDLIFQVLVFIVGGYWVIKDQLSIVYFVASLQYFGFLLSVIEDLFSLSVDYQIYKASCDRLNELFLLKQDDIGAHKLEGICEITFRHFNLLRRPNNSGMYDQALDICLKKGHCYRFVGKNGAGKTSLLLALIGIHSNYQGSISFNGTELPKIEHQHLRKEKISFMLQSETFPEVSIQEFFEVNLNEAELEGLLKNQRIHQLFPLLFSSKEMWNKNIRDLSGGEQRMILFIISLAKEADLYLLDEPFTNIYQSLIVFMEEAIAELVAQDKIVVLISHGPLTFLKTNEIEIQ